MKKNIIMGSVFNKKPKIEPNQLINPSDTNNDNVNNRKNPKIYKETLIEEISGDPFLDYEVLNSIGEGSFGKVYKIRNKKSSELFAMKEINKNSRFCKEEENQLKNEINILMKLDHQNILKVYEYYNNKIKIYIISELCTGGELFDMITLVKHFSEKVSANIFKQILSAVSYCHKNNIIHRDLKPENILIEKDDHNEYFKIKVIDFGASEVYKKNTYLREKIGTSFYMAPEILKKSYNEKSDLWSCGVILYILLSGEPPFYGITDEEIYIKIWNCKYQIEGEIWNEISSEAKDLIKNLLNKDHKLRFSAEQALNHIWFRKFNYADENKFISNENLSKK